METGKIVLKIIGLIIVSVGIVCVYDARRLTKRFFNKSDTNEVTEKMKKIGALVSIVGGVLVVV